MTCNGFKTQKNQVIKCNWRSVTLVMTSIIGLAPARSRMRAKKLPLKSIISTYILWATKTKKSFSRISSWEACQLCPCWDKKLCQYNFIIYVNPISIILTFTYLSSFHVIMETTWSKSSLLEATARVYTPWNQVIQSIVLYQTERPLYSLKSFFFLTKPKCHIQTHVTSC